MLTNAARFWLLETTNDTFAPLLSVVGRICASGAARSDGSTCGPCVTGGEATGGVSACRARE